MPKPPKGSETQKNRASSAARSPIFFVLASIFVALILAVLFGLLYTSTAFQTTLKPGGSLLDGLIANGISVVLSVILISPLTAYFISRRREQQLAPVRRSFVEAIASEVDRLATFYTIKHLSMVTLFLPWKRACR